MKVNGKKLANEIEKDLKKRTDQLLSKGITPKIAIVTLGQQDTWKVYVSRKTSLASKLGMQATVYNLKDFTQEDLEKFITNLNEDNSTHGIIIQRPLPDNFEESRVVEIVSKEKDIDGFRNDSSFTSPVAKAVILVLEKIFKKNVKSALKGKKVVVIGKGVTGGGPTISELHKLGIGLNVIDSKSTNRQKKLKNADILISAVGKKVLDSNDIKKGAVVIGIGTRVENEKIKGDIEEKGLDQKASAYTPTPGGIGPLNLVFLFSNLLTAAEKSI